jgi:hypothetical protein
MRDSNRPTAARLLPTGLALGLVACSADDPIGSAGSEPDATGTGDTGTVSEGTDEDGDPGGEDGADDGGTTGDDGGSEDPGSSGDTGDGDTDDGGGDVETGCKGVDFLVFVESTHTYSLDKTIAQQRLADAFPGFVDGVAAALGEAGDPHVGVVTNDAYIANGEGCVQTGAFLTRNGQKTCGPFADGHRFMTGADDLATSFECVAVLGTTGTKNNAHVWNAMRAAGEDTNAPGACNAGFMRDDALLVLVLLSEEDDVHGPGTPADPEFWASYFADRKGGHLENVVALPIVRGVPGSFCADATEASDGERFMAFAEELGDNGLAGDACAAEYGQFFTDATQVVARACDAFVRPQG